MHTHMPIGIDNYGNAKENYYVVDKTKFISTFLKNHAQVTLFTRPRRFGKTMMLSMLRFFFDVVDAARNRHLFNGTTVADDAEAMKQQGTYPVLFLKLRDWKYADWATMQAGIATGMQEALQPYAFLLDSARVSDVDKANFRAIQARQADITVLMGSVAMLLRMLHAHYGRLPVLLLDEYDLPVQYAWEHGYYEQAIGFFRVFLTAALKSNDDLAFAVLTGVLRIAKESIFSDLNNVKVDSLLHAQYPEAFGFTPAEVRHMAEDLGCEDKLPEIQHWYDGYRFSGCAMYNPWSVINYFDNDCQPRTYWVNTSGNAILGEMLRYSRSQVLDKLEILLQGGSIETRVREGFIYSEIYKQESALYTMLVTTGYLTIKRVHEDELGMQAELMLPNRELRSLFRIEILERYRGGDMDMETEDLMRAFVSGDVETVRTGLAQYLELLTSSFDAARGKEAFYHGLILGLTATLVEDYHIRSNRESGYGRYDIAAFPRRAGLNGMIIECKVAECEEALADKAQEALQQIAVRDYDAEFRAQGIGKVFHYGIAFCGKKVQIASQGI